MSTALILIEPGRGNMFIIFMLSDATAVGEHLALPCAEAGSTCAAPFVSEETMVSVSIAFVRMS